MATQGREYERLEDIGAVKQWRIAGIERVYSSRWVSVDLVDVAPPGCPIYRHHVVRLPAAVGVIVRRHDGKVLLMHRHRFITGTVGFEIPAGAIDEGESVEDAARREVLEETGFYLHSVRRTYSCSPSDGTSDQRFHFAIATVADDSGRVVDAHESSARVWVDREQASELIRDGLVPGALTSVALLHALWTGEL